MRQPIYLSIRVPSLFFLLNDLLSTSLKIDVIIILFSEHMFHLLRRSLSYFLIVSVKAYICFVILADSPCMIRTCAWFLIHWKILCDSWIRLILCYICSCHLRVIDLLSFLKKEAFEVLTILLSAHEVWVRHF